MVQAASEAEGSIPVHEGDSSDDSRSLGFARDDIYGVQRYVYGFSIA